MQKRRALFGALALTLCVGVAGVAFGATRSARQTILGDFSPVKLPKKKKVPITIHVRTATADAADPASCNSSTHVCSGTTPPVANHAFIDFDNDLAIFPNAVPKCSLSSISSQNTAGARAACASSMIGKGSAQVILGGVPGQSAGLPANGLPVVVSAFNGQPQNGHPTIYLHSKPSGAPAVVLIGELINSPQPGDYGKRLDVNVPPTGGPLTFFDTLVGKVSQPTGAANVGRGPYVKARCHDPNRLFNFHGRFNYDDSGGTYADHADAFDTDKCKVKRRRHRR